MSRFVVCANANLEHAQEPEYVLGFTRVLDKTQKTQQIHVFKSFGLNKPVMAVIALGGAAMLARRARMGKVEARRGKDGLTRIV